MPTIQANGLDVAYLVEGAGPPLIALHGAAGSGPAHLAGLLPSLTTGFRVYAPDARRHAGTRGAADDQLETAVLADDVLAFADALGVETFHLFGYSMGAMTALHVASSVPERLRTLVVVSITAEREPRLAVVRRLLDVERIERDDPVWAAQLAARHDPVQGPGAWRSLLAAIVEDVATQPLLGPADLRRIDAPTLVAVGDRDPLVPVAQAHALARQVRSGHLLVLPDVGHDALAARPALLTTALLEHYRATEAVARARAGVPLTAEARP